MPLTYFITVTAGFFQLPRRVDTALVSVYQNLEQHEVLDYIAGNLSNSSAAEALYQKLTVEIDNICGQPYSFPDCSYYLIDDENIRHTVIGNYVLIFEVSKDENTIKFLRFLYGGMDISHKQITS